MREAYCRILTPCSSNRSSGQEGVYGVRNQCTGCTGCRAKRLCLFGAASIYAATGQCLAWGFGRARHQCIWCAAASGKPLLELAEYPTQSLCLDVKAPPNTAQRISQAHRQEQIGARIDGLVHEWRYGTTLGVETNMYSSKSVALNKGPWADQQPTIN